MKTDISLSCRQGSAILVVLGVLVVLFGILFAATQRQVGTKMLLDTDRHAQEATYAAEAVAAMLESKLTNLSGNLDNLTQDLSTRYNDGSENFWNLRGWQPAAGETDPRPTAEIDRPLRFGNCVVRWRLEPVIVSSQPTTGALPRSYTDLPAGAQFAVNNVANLSEATWQSFLASSSMGVNGAMPGGQLFKENSSFYHFRIITQACRVSDPGKADPRPWQDVTDRYAAAQATRVVQLKLQSLFKYVIFYAAAGPTGDLDLWAGATIAINGAVHSNASIYLGGQGGGHLSGDYHGAASSGNQTDIGTAASPVMVTGVDGIFRMRKPVNLYAVLKGVSGASTDPMQIPLSGVGAMTGKNDLNGNDAASSNMRINGQNFTYQVDSRRALSSTFGTTSMESRFSGRVRDKQLGASFVRTLANIPQLAGRPLESVCLAPDNGALYVRAATAVPAAAGVIDFTAPVAAPANLTAYASFLANLTINPAGSNGRLFYTSDPSSGTAQFSTTASAWPVPSTGLHLYWQDTARRVSDVAPVTDDYPRPLQHPSTAAGALGYDGYGFRTNECAGYYLDRAVNGLENSGTTGLTIRERPWPAAVTPVPSQVVGVVLQSGGSGYTSVPTVTFTSSDTGCLASAVAVLPSGPINGNPTITNQGNGYTTVPTVTFTGGGGSGAAGLALIDKQLKTATTSPYRLTLTTTGTGSGYTSTPTVTVSTAGLRSGPGLTATATWNSSTKKITSIVFTDSGGTTNPSRYTSAPLVTIAGGGGSGASMILNFSSTSHFDRGKVYAITMTSAGSGYISAPTIGLTGGGYSTLAVASCSVLITDGVAGQIQRINLSYGGMGYMTAPTVSITGGGAATAATATAFLPGRPISGTFAITSGGTGYVSAPMVNITGGGGGGATAEATIAAGKVTAITLTNGGYGYTSNPSFTIAAPAAGTTATATATWTLAPAPVGPSPQVRQAWHDYLCSQYVVLFGGHDVTDLFFRQVQDTTRAPAASDFLVSEDNVMNRREAVYLAKFYGLTDAQLNAFGGTGCPRYRINMLTLNMRKVQDFIKYTYWEKDILGDAASTDTARAKTRFNGLIYVARTRRSSTYDPIMAPQLTFNPGLNATTGEVTTPMAYNAGSPAVPLSEATDATDRDGDGVLGPNFPHLYREGSGGVETAHAAIRLRNGSQIDWNHDADDNGVDEPSTVLGRSGLTVITPNPLYLQGDYNRQVLTSVSGATETWQNYTLTFPAGQPPQPSTAHAGRLPPCAIFADGVVSLSNAWSDGAYTGTTTPVNNQGPFQRGASAALPTAGNDVHHYASMVINNVPSQDWNALEEGSGAVTNVLRFCESSGSGRTMSFLGSLVVLNEQRYSRGTLGTNNSPQNLDTKSYGAPGRNYYFNSDLLQSSGQPPFSPFGIEVTRVVSRVDRL